MTVVQIKLSGGQWEFDDANRLGSPGGFGEVFLGTGSVGLVAIKRLKIDADTAAHRELTIGNTLMKRDLKHIVPIIDLGQDAESDRYYLVMPVCDESLQAAINRQQEGLTEQDIYSITNAIIAGLLEVPDITHRDLKPSNILLHDGVWKIADFGIAKFVEDSTSVNTLRRSLTPAYAAPEQWSGERPSGATDIYALGCIVHALMNGKPPFQGSVDDVREQHLHSPAPELPRGPAS